MLVYYIWNHSTVTGLTGSIKKINVSTINVLCLCNGAVKCDKEFSAK
jgi:hypothetical protein